MYLFSYFRDQELHEYHSYLEIFTQVQIIMFWISHFAVNIYPANTVLEVQIVNCFAARPRPRRHWGSAGRGWSVAEMSWTPICAMFPNTRSLHTTHRGHRARSLADTAAAPRADWSARRAAARLGGDNGAMADCVSAPHNIVRGPSLAPASIAVTAASSCLRHNECCLMFKYLHYPPQPFKQKLVCSGCCRCSRWRSVLHFLPKIRRGVSLHTRYTLDTLHRVSVSEERCPGHGTD